MNEQVAMAFNVPTVSAVEVNSVSVKCQGREAEKEQWWWDKCSGNLRGLRCYGL